MPSFQVGKSIQQEVRNARMVGEFAVKIGIARIPGLVLSILKKAQAHSGPPVVRINPDRPVQPDRDKDNSVTETPIVGSHEDDSREPISGYDVLTTQQVIDAYETLSNDERESVRVYESRRRARGTVMQRYGEGFGNKGS
jgi:hypothetical protein